MDELGYLKRRRAQELLRARAATCEAARQVHETLAKLFDDRIELVNEKTGLPKRGQGQSYNLEPYSPMLVVSPKPIRMKSALEP
jgi:hypothetical protein